MTVAAGRRPQRGGGEEGARAGERAPGEDGAVGGDELRDALVVLEPRHARQLAARRAGPLRGGGELGRASPQPLVLRALEIGGEADVEERRRPRPAPPRAPR